MASSLGCVTAVAQMVTERLLEWLHISVTLSLKAVPINQKGDQAVHIYSLNR